MSPDESAPFLLHLLGVKEESGALEVLSPEAVKSRTFEIIRRLAIGGARQRPTVVALEDLHWIDRTSEELFDALAESIAGAPILILATYRPGYRPPWMERSNATQIALAPLSEPDSLAVVRASLGPQTLTDALARVVLDKAEGNPFYLEELSRTLREHTGAEALAVPDTVHGVIMARIDRLPDETRRLLQIASVLGREIPVRWLATLWEGPDLAEAHLRELARMEFLYRRGDREEPAYAFRHALTQEVAYASLLERNREAYHAAAGRGLESLHQGRLDDVVELLAHHFGRSGEAEKALDYALLAAAKARRRWANRESLAHFEAAARRLDAMPDTGANRLRRIDVVVEQAEVKFALGQHQEHIAALSAIRDLVHAAADPRRRAAWYYWVGFLESFTGGRLEIALAHCREASRTADAGGIEEIRGFAECCIGHVSVLAGDLRGALAAGERALAIFEARGNVWWACRALWGLNMATNPLGAWARGLDYCRRALDHGRAVDDLRLKVVGLWRTGSTHIQRGAVETGLGYCEEALGLSPTPFDAAMVRGVHGYGLVRSGRIEAGIGELEETLAWFDRSHLRYTWCVFTSCLAEGYLRAGRRADARAALDRVERLGREVGYRHLQGVAHRLLAESLAPDDEATARHHADTAIAILDEVGAANELARALATRAEIARRAGQGADARPLLERALFVFESLGTLDEPPRVRALLAELGPA
jgi:tetratricopeptide (TPR) repeat protein